MVSTIGRYASFAVCLYVKLLHKNYHADLYLIG